MLYLSLNNKDIYFLLNTQIRPTQYLHFWCSILWARRTTKSLVRNSWVLSVQR